jgi:hypothetical protein
MDRWMGGGMDTNMYIIDCLRQVAAFAPKVIRSAYGATMNGRRNG